jgi:hypothetical protein
VSFRTDARTGTVGVLTSYQTSYPTQILKVWTARPSSLALGELPCAFVSAIDCTQLVHTVGVRPQELQVTVTIADVFPDNEEAEARLDTLIEGLCDAFSTTPHAIDGYSILEPVSYSEGTLEAGTSRFVGIDLLLRARKTVGIG